MTEQEKIERRLAQKRASAAKRRERLKKEGYSRRYLLLTDDEAERARAFLASFRMQQQGAA